MINQCARVGFVLVSVLISGCIVGDGSEVDEEDVEDVETLELAAANLEYQVTTNSCGELEDIYVVYSGTAETEYATGYYKYKQEDFCVYDGSPDGRRVGVHWRLTDGSRRGLCVVTTGNNTAGACYKDLPEGREMEFRVGRCDGGKYACNTPSAGWTDWSGWLRRGI